MKIQLPKDFLWGTATAAHQVEGNIHNNWTVWESSVANKLAKDAENRLASEPSWERIKEEASDPANYITGNAADHYNRFKTDIALLDELGCNAFRFSIEWARIEPKPGKYDKQALDHYAQVIDELKKRGIKPFVTLHHFTNPTWLDDQGGWHGDKVVDLFGGYVQAVADYIGRDVEYWCTVNEPGSYLLMRYLGGGAWPEWPLMSFNLGDGYRYLKNVAASHKKAAREIKKVNSQAKLGIANGMLDYQLERADPLSWLAKKQVEYIPDVYLLNRIKNDIDYIGVNYYMRMVIKSGFSHPASWGKKWNGRDPQNDMGWGIYPEGLYNITQGLKKYNLPLIIAENGIPDASDNNRAKFINEHVNSMLRSINDGADIRGYFYWSLLDNYEWSEGYWPKFGLVSVDRKSMQRTLRPSAKAYTEIINSFKS
ncbi:MAG: glycoside hydrolase family 1 protein [Candidatus Saccharimonadales bacterium]